MAISSSEKRNWRGICIALLVISAVLSIIVFSIFLLSPGMCVCLCLPEIRKITFVISFRSHARFLLALFLLIKIYIFLISISAFLDDFALFPRNCKKIYTRSHKNDISNRGREDIWEAYSLIRHLQWLAQMEAFQWLMDKWWDFLSLFLVVLLDEQIRLKERHGEEVKNFFHHLIINDINHYFSCSFSTRHDDYRCHYHFGTFLNVFFLLLSFRYGT